MTDEQYIMALVLCAVVALMLVYLNLRDDDDHHY